LTTEPSTSTSTQAQPQAQAQSQQDREASKEKYLFIKPGKEMHRALVEKRAAVRAIPSTADTNPSPGTLEEANGKDTNGNGVSNTIPSKELIEYAQGLLLTGYLGEVVVYVFEWVWK
jgi:hypothetical protein